ncbi:hypothetical protein XELAEV_18035967mg [Xenopus laevis]|uniref:Uncharacterized protein n=1 Tax=Xenopus laevis TaxID=8355 RepID=A0A974CGP3_XENLA|nr:hypothetical protein XELAEV_18035967mg [Xenopus laevis]
MIHKKPRIFCLCFLGFWLPFCLFICGYIPPCVPVYPCYSMYRLKSKWMLGTEGLMCMLYSWCVVDLGVFS